MFRLVIVGAAMDDPKTVHFIFYVVTPIYLTPKTLNVVDNISFKDIMGVFYFESCSGGNERVVR